MVLRAALDPDRYIAPLIKALSDLVDQLVRLAAGDDIASAVPGYDALDFPNQFASLVGITHGRVFDHLDPAFNMYDRGYRCWRNAPQSGVSLDIPISPTLVYVDGEL